ncbi:hypothetical protein MSAN_00451100 [Mycena sanguinolenta]|uniref:Uncharacterized protein n=1 Tax=Mycena sanguinolenta TaxID=230812 RepID=A0A8H6ZDX7_9AGAR|nr:hypothetical protein MSAN_00451100 [Mycena sanguinolenta]
MKFLAALFALMAVASVSAAPAHPPQPGAAQVAKAKGGKTANNKNSNSNNNSAANATSVTAAPAVANSTGATSTSTAASATRTRPCDQGDQSLAAGLSAAVVIGIGQQASVLTLQNSTAAADFATAQQRLQQFTDTAALQLQMAQGIADDDSFAQTQLGLLATSQATQETLVKSLVGGDVTTSADTLNQLLQSFLDSTNNAQDGAEQALIDCFLPLTAVSG